MYWYALMTRDPVISYSLAGLLLMALISIGSYLALELPALGAYAAGSTLSTFLLCGYDKGIAGSGRTRVPERVFYGLALIGGSLGLLLGMKFFRHKTQKASFQFFLALVLAIQLSLYFYFAGRLLS